MTEKTSMYTDKKGKLQNVMPAGWKNMNEYCDTASFNQKFEYNI